MQQETIMPDRVWGFVSDGEQEGRWAVGVNQTTTKKSHALSQQQTLIAKETKPIAVLTGNREREPGESMKDTRQGFLM